MSETKNKKPTRRPPSKSRGGPRNSRRPKKSDYRKLRNISKFLNVLQKRPEEESFVVFDIETTGGNPERNGLTEFCGLLIEGGKVVDEYLTLINPEVPIPPIVRKMTGINDRMVRKAPKINEVMPDIVKFIGNRIVVSHNTIGDLKFIRHFSEKVCEHRFENFFICTHLLSEKVFNDSPDKSLMGLAKYLNLEFDGAHRAKADAIITHKLLEALLMKLKSKSILTSEQIIRYQGDYESSFRLGWGVGKQALRDLPEQAGIFLGRSLAGDHLYCASAASIQNEVKELMNYSELPKPFLRKVFQTYDIEHKPAKDLIHAVRIERQVNRKNKLMPIGSYSHQRRINTLSFERSENGDFYVTNGFANDKSVLALGPVYDRRVASIVLERIAGSVGQLIGKSKLHIEPYQLLPVYALLTNRVQEYEQYLRRKQSGIKSFLFSRHRSFLVEALNVLESLKAIDVPATFHDLFEIEGTLSVRGEQIFDYEIKRSKVAKESSSSLKAIDSKKAHFEQSFSKPPSALHKMTAAKHKPLKDFEVWELICWLIFSGKGRRISQFKKR